MSKEIRRKCLLYTKARKLILSLFLIVFVAFGTIVGCGSDGGGGDSGGDSGNGQLSLVLASEWVNSVDWDQRQVVEVEMVETADGFFFEPDELTFEAGKPYVLEITSPPDNLAKHYFSTEGLGDFYQAIATRKIETPDAEYKAPYFKEVELLVGGSLEIYFVPVLPGIYDTLCTIPGHKELGMFGKITITGGEGNQLDLEVDPIWDSALADDPRTSGSHSVWDSLVEVEISMEENTSFTHLGFVPPDIELSEGTAYEIVLDNPAENTSKHYYTAAEFYKTVVWRKAEDSNAEIKFPYLKAVEVLVGGFTELYMVPTQIGEYPTVCTIPGHADLGMVGTITVD